MINFNAFNNISVNSNNHTDITNNKYKLDPNELKTLQIFT